ncbi:MAG: hypothetical protein H6930_06600 [Rhodoferax sp.]|nr:hypothetical protein [Rhodoferax sp.]
MNKDQPLELTVHTLPRVDGTDVNVKRTRIGRWQMLLVLLICAAPVVASYLTYYVVRPQARSVFGTLVDPQRPLPDLMGVAPDGAASNLRALKGQWLLVTVSGGACDATCQQYLYMQRQLRESLGKEKDRVDRVWLINDDVAIAPALLPALQGAVVLRVPPTELAAWLAPQQGHALAEHLYLVDPMGNWMMRFPAGLDLKGAAKAKRDIERVLRASSSWDEAGR